MKRSRQKKQFSEAYIILVRRTQSLRGERISIERSSLMAPDALNIKARRTSIVVSCVSIGEVLMNGRTRCTT